MFLRQRRLWENEAWSAEESGAEVGCPETTGMSDNE